MRSSGHLLELDVIDVNILKPDFSTYDFGKSILQIQKHDFFQVSVGLGLSLFVFVPGGFHDFSVVSKHDGICVVLLKVVVPRRPEGKLVLSNF